MSGIKYKNKLYTHTIYISIQVNKEKIMTNTV